MKRHLFLILFLSNSLFGFSQDTSSINFIIKNLGVNVDGHFNAFSITADFNSKNKLKGLSSTIDVASIKTGIESRDEHILKEDYFYVEEHEFIILKSLDLTEKTKDNYVVKANISIKGKTKTITIPITVETIGSTYKITSNFEIDRKDFDVGGGSFILSKNVKISVVHYQKI